MPSLRRRRHVIAGLLVAVGALAIAVLWNVVEVVFFAVTVAYVLYPVRQRLVAHGVPRRIASAAVTIAAFLVVILLLMPIALALFERRGAFIELLNNLPDDLPIEVLGFAYEIDIADLTVAANDFLRSLALSLAADAPFITLEFSMFVLILYGLLLRPQAVGRAAYEITPPAYHDVLRALHERVAGTLFALYVIQAATAVLTFPIAVIVFYALGYPDVFVLAVLSAILQFFPIVGPGTLVLGLAGYDVLLGMPGRAVGVLILGSLLVGLLPDILIRPRMASQRARLPASLYFVGFVGGVLTIGIIGIIAGPLVVAVLVELVGLLSNHNRDDV
jgi:predicted PurR-regulated permease PerM